MCFFGCKHKYEDDVTKTKIQKHDFERDNTKDHIWSRITKIIILDRKWPIFIEKYRKNNFRSAFQRLNFVSEWPRIDQFQSERSRGLELNGRVYRSSSNLIHKTVHFYSKRPFSDDFLESCSQDRLDFVLWTTVGPSSLIRDRLISVVSVFWFALEWTVPFESNVAKNIRKSNMFLIKICSCRNNTFSSISKLYVRLKLKIKLVSWPFFRPWSKFKFKNDALKHYDLLYFWPRNWSVFDLKSRPWMVHLIMWFYFS